MSSATVPVEFGDPTNAKILAVSEDRVQGFQRDPIGEIARLSGVAAPTVLERYKQLDTEPDGAGPEAFLALVRSETPKWADVVKKSGAKVD